ncbi:hypothetical protein BMETH_16881741604, partial [methanotrophic bacterial endosymbiont of Bathymodiolus sp.]
TLILSIMNCDKWTMLSGLYYIKY